VKPTRSTRTSAAIQSPHTRGLAAQEPARIDGPSFGEGTRDRIARAWTRFWFTPVDAIGLHVIRLLAGLLFIAWLLPFAGYLEGFFGIRGWLDTRAFAEAARLSNGEFFPSWSVLYLCGENTALIATVYWVSLAILAAFALGIYPRVTAVLTWVIVASFTANPAFEYEGDALLLIQAFYLMIAYVLLGQLTPGLSWRARLLGPALVWPLGRTERNAEGEQVPSVAANVMLRLLQVHFALVVFTSGLHKLQFGDWWAGVALWFPLHPPFKTTLAEAMANKPYADTYLSLLNIGTYAVLAWQIGFPLFAWRPRWRPVLIGGAVIGWLGSAFLWGLPLIGPAILIGCLSFVSPAGWRRVLAWLPGNRTAQTASATQSEQTPSLVAAGQR
jgi:hypothetical protein